MDHADVDGAQDPLCALRWRCRASNSKPERMGGDVHSSHALCQRGGSVGIFRQLLPGSEFLNALDFPSFVTGCYTGNVQQHGPMHVAQEILKDLDKVGLLNLVLSDGERERSRSPVWAGNSLSSPHGSGASFLSPNPLSISATDHELEQLVMSGNSISFDLDQSHGDLLSSAHRWSPISIGGISRLSGASTSRGNISLSPLGSAPLPSALPKEAASGKTPRKGKRGRKPKAKKQPTEQEVNKKNKKKKPKVEKTKKKKYKKHVSEPELVGQEMLLCEAYKVKEQFLGMHAVVLGASPVSGGWFDVAALKNDGTVLARIKWRRKGLLPLTGPAVATREQKEQIISAFRVEEAEALRRGLEEAKKSGAGDAHGAASSAKRTSSSSAAAAAASAAAAMVKKATTTEAGLALSWLEVLEPVRNLKTNNGKPIQRLVDVALTRLSDAPDGVEEVLRCARRSDVCKFNSAGQAKKLVLSLLAGKIPSLPDLPPETPRQKKRKS